MRLRELTGETRLTISGKFTGEIPLATQGERRQFAAGCLGKSGAQNGQKKKPAAHAASFFRRPTDTLAGGCRSTGTGNPPT